ncbi:FAD-dependent monooxygenase [Haladaptatus salinisoli]|uniref:oxidoreductase n=1 Tax=Haladaptatus salinisoli TaxID=2884876 RepID=UPI001D0B2177|nr:FAD-dependent monooxygenase [Haladaptatus salinisoli]
MKVDVLGGGPGGLYVSLLLKKSFPEWEITVHERDPADNTYGWGVVFSDATLSSLREADRPSHERITDAFVRWDPIDIYYDGEYFRCNGHSFAGIMRSDLLSILQTRADELGVTLRHGEAIDDPERLREEADVLIGADGLNSTVRETYDRAFRPNTSAGNAKFAWFGTDKPFDVFTFIFRENEHGLWRVHAYPGRKSTFIVECTEETWAAAGMDDASEEEALDYFEELFADHVGAYELEAKLYAWRNFPTVRNATWSHENVVLIGDAAHTAHFSIGSGTKMAMEDAIALQEAFEEHGRDVRAAFNWYEKERRPRVQGLQEAAERSENYFENVERYRNLRPRRFAFNLLTRSGRITYDNLRVRDPSFVDRFDQWFAAAEGEGTTAVATPPLFKHLSLREVRIPNRTVMTLPPTETATDGRPADSYLDRLVKRGERGPGMLLTDPLAVAPDGRITTGTPGLYADEHADALGEAIARVRDASPAETVVGAHLFHAGRRGATKSRERGLDRPLPERERWELLAPSSKPFGPASPTPTAMNSDDLDRVREAFVTAAERADTAGFDHLQLHAGHGYLLSSFLSPLSNDRDDEYGGSLENRMRYPIEVFDAVRGAWPEEKSLGVTLQATDWNLNGLKTHESYEVARSLEERDCDLLAIVAGRASVRERPQFDTDTLGRFSEQFRNEIEVPTLSTNYLTTYDEVNTMVGGGRADLVSFYPENPVSNR